MATAFLLILAFIDPDRRIQVLERDIAATELSAYDVLIVLDTSAWIQLGPMADVVRDFAGQKIVIDHHVSEDDFGARTFKEPTAEATGRLCSRQPRRLASRSRRTMAAPLFAAIATDTGWFRFSSVDERTFGAAAKLVAAGASPTATFNSLYERNSLSRLHLRAKILDAAARAGRADHSLTCHAGRFR